MSETSSTWGPFTSWNTAAAIPDVGREVPGCDECNRDPGTQKFWPIFTVDYHGEEVCAKCLTPMRLPRRRPA